MGINKSGNMANEEDDKKWSTVGMNSRISNRNCGKWHGNSDNNSTPDMLFWLDRSEPGAEKGKLAGSLLQPS